MCASRFSSESGAARLLAAAYIGAGLLAGVALMVGYPLVFGSAPSDAGGEGAPAGPGGGPPGGFPPAPVDIVAAVETIAAEPVQLLGSVAPRRAAMVASEVDGLVVDLSVDEGDAVRAGQVMVRLRTANVEQQLLGARASEREQAARLTRAEVDFGRLASLLERSAISQREYDQAVADRDALAGGVERLRAEVDRLEDRLERATIVAPFGGRVTAVSVEVGEWVGQGDTIAALVDLSEVEVQVQVTERYISAVQRGFEVDVTFDAFPGQVFPGRVTAVVPEAVPEARTFPVLVRVANPQRAIKGGMAARVTAQLGSPTPTVLVAKDALVRCGRQVHVFRLNPDGANGSGGEGTTGSVEQLYVETGPALGQWQVVYGAVAGGDLIVVRGNERLFPGQPSVVSAVRALEVPEADPDRPIASDPRRDGRQ